jgi:3-hydroxyisobutyrate dehydrogenase-like beta-hydroxyacid dehydrogenase
MAANVAAAGFELVVCDVRPEATVALEDGGAVRVESPAAVAERVDVVLSMLPTPESVVEVAHGSDGLGRVDGAGKTWIDFSSIDKMSVLEIDAELSGAGWTLMDASVNGVEEEAAAGTLRTWASGPRESFERYEPLLDSMSMLVVYMGGLGNAKLVKTANAMLAGIMHMSMMEVYTWVTAAGMTEEDWEAFLRSSRNFSPAIERVMKIMLSHRFKERTSWMAKDLSFGIDVAKELRVPLPFTRLAHEMFVIAQANGLDGYEATGVAWHAYAVMSGQDRFPPTEGVPLD